MTDHSNGIRNKLLRLRAELESEVADSTETDVDLDPSRIGRLSRMDAMQDHAMARAAADRRDGRLRLVAAALRRLDHGDYGACRRCESDIDPRRLDIDPLVLYCIDCASRAET